MKRTIVIIVGLLTLCAGAVGVQAGEIENLILNHEVSAANFFGTNARALAMGQTGIATALDGSAIMYNPAALARIRRLEVRGGLSHLRSENTTEYERGRYPGYTSVVSSADREVSKTVFNGLSVSIPAPTYRGSLVAAFSVHRVKDFDRSFEQQLVDTNATTYVDKAQIETESGGIYAWSGAAAIEISPKMAVGGALHLYTGTAKYGAEYENLVRRYAAEIDDTVSRLFSDYTAIESGHIGVSGTVGFTYQASSSFSMGAVIETPSFWNVEEDSHYDSLVVYDTTSSYYYWVVDAEDENRFAEYNMRHPFSLGLGAGFSHERLNLALDLKYTDWSQFEYTDEFSQDLNRQIQDNYHEVLEFRVGAEYVLPDPGISLRVGYFRDPLPFPTDYVKDDRQYFTFGVGFLIDKVMTIDLAAILGGYTIQYYDPLPYTEEYKTRRVYLTMGYRM